jgi:hypothetical protein
MPNRADGFGAVTLATVRQVQDGPFFDQRMKAQRHLGAFAFRIAPHAQALCARVDPFGYVAETSSGSYSGFLDRDASPHSDALTNLPLGRRIGPLHDEGAGFGRNPHTEAATLAVEDQAIFAAYFQLQPGQIPIGEFCHPCAFEIADLMRTSGKGPLWVRMAIYGED